MFTFSFSSAFATVADADKLTAEKMYTAIDKAYEAAKAEIASAKKAALDAVCDGTYDAYYDATTLEVSRAVIEAAYDKYLYTPALEKAAVEYSALYEKVKTGLGTTGVDYFAVGSSEGKDGDTYVINVTFSKKDKNGTDATNVEKYKDIFKGYVSGWPGTASKEVLQDAFEALADDTITAINAIDESKYSDEANGTTASYRKQVADAKAAAIDEIRLIAVAMQNIDADADEITWGVVVKESGVVTKGFAKAVTSVYTPAVNEADPSGSLWNAIKDIPTLAKEPTEAAKLEFAQKMAISYFTDKINTELGEIVKYNENIILNEKLLKKPDTEVIYNAERAIETAKEQAAAAIEVATYLVKDCDAYSKIIKGYDNNPSKFNAAEAVVNEDIWKYTGTLADKSFSDNGIKVLIDGTTTKTYDMEKAAKISSHVADLKDQAALLKASIAIDGTTPVDVDKMLEKAIDDAYKGDLTVKLTDLTDEDVLDARIHALADNKTAGTDTVKINNTVYTVVADWSEAGYDATKTKAVKAVKKETRDAIYAAKTVADAEAAFLEGLAKYKAIPTLNDRTVAQATKEFKTLLDKYKAEIDAYVTYKNAGLVASKTDKNYAWTPNTFTTNLQTKLGKAYTVDELNEKYAAAKAEVDNLKDAATIKADQKAIQDKVDAVKTVTVADKEAVANLLKEIQDHNDYVTLVGAGADKKILVPGNAKNAIVDIEKLDEKAMTDAYRTINADGKATLTEKAAVEELRAAYDAYVEFYTELADYSDDYTFTDIAYEDEISKLENDIFWAEVHAVEEMIAKLPVNATASEVAAAQNAYNALDLCQRVSVADKYYDKLADYNKVLVNAVEALKITASSKATKGAITVKWTVKEGDASAADGFQVWKSTKMNKGYKKAFTTTKTTYKNTKGLKKGVKYYYKVRAYKVVDGVNVYSDWSNKAYRTAQ